MEKRVTRSQSGGAGASASYSAAVAQPAVVLAAAKKTYIVCAENNTKENETTYYYLQYNGNEAAIARFAKVMARVESMKNSGCDIVWHQLSSPSTLLSEATVDELVAVRADINGHFFASFSKYDGVLSFNNKKYDAVDDDAAFEMWQEDFYFCRSPGVKGLFAGKTGSELEDSDDEPESEEES